MDERYKLTPKGYAMLMLTYLEEGEFDLLKDTIIQLLNYED